MEILVFEVDRQRFAIRLADVQEVVRAVAIAPLPEAPAVVEGLINLRGALVPVIDMRGRFGLPRRPLALSDHMVVLSTRPRIAALRVDRVVDIERVDERDIVPSSSLTSGVERIAGVAKVADGMVFLHDLETFLSESERESLNDALLAVKDAS